LNPNEPIALLIADAPNLYAEVVALRAERDAAGSAGKDRGVNDLLGTRRSPTPAVTGTFDEPNSVRIARAPQRRTPMRTRVEFRLDARRGIVERFAVGRGAQLRGGAEPVGPEMGVFRYRGRSHHWTYGWSDRLARFGDGALIEARGARREVGRFCGYDWMVDNIIRWGTAECRCEWRDAPNFTPGETWNVHLLQHHRQVVVPVERTVSTPRYSRDATYDWLSDDSRTEARWLRDGTARVALSDMRWVGTRSFAPGHGVAVWRLDDDSPAGREDARRRYREHKTKCPLRLGLCWNPMLEKWAANRAPIAQRHDQREGA